MKTSHQLARDLLALPELPCYHLDPSYAHVGEGENSLSDPRVDVDKSSGKRWVTISGTQSEDHAEDFNRDDNPTIQMLKAQLDDAKQSRDRLRDRCAELAARSNEVIPCDEFFVRKP